MWPKPWPHNFQGKFQKFLFVEKYQQTNLQKKYIYEKEGLDCISMQITAEKRGLNYYTSKDNFYSIKIKSETLVIRAKIRLKAQF